MIAKEQEAIEIEINQKQVGQTQHFRYLGIAKACDRKQDMDIKIGIGKNYQVHGRHNVAYKLM